MMQIRYLVNGKPITSWMDIDLFRIMDVKRLFKCFNNMRVCKNWQIEYKEV